MKKQLKKIGLIIIVLSIVSMAFLNISYAADTVDKIMQGADSFISQGESSSSIDNTALKSTSDFLYNLLLGIGMIVAVVVGVILGIKYMIGSVEEKAELKETVWAYLISCVVVFGAFGIWKIAVNILQAM